MPDNIIPMTIPWVILTIVVIALAFYKKSLDSHVDEHLHIDAQEDRMVQAQVAQAKRSEMVEMWGKILTVVVFLYGLGIVGMIAYHQWQINTTAGFR